MKSARVNSIDILKFIGLSLIILAHVNPPYLLAQIRCFDVPLMLFVSGLAYSNKSIDNYWRFILPRCKRLVIPIFLFLSVYFVMEVLLKKIGVLESSTSILTIFCSYAMMNTKAIPFVWIIRVFLLIMIFTPPLISFSTKISNLKFILLCIFMLFSLELIVFLLSKIILYKYIYYPAYEVLPFLVGYSLPFMLGLKLRNANTIMNLKALSLCVILFLLCSWLYNDTSKVLTLTMYKFPPRAYFISYGILISVILWINKSIIEKLLYSEFTIFVGKHSIWIYLYHIPALYLVNTWNLGWGLTYLLVYFFAFSFFMLQYMIVNKYLNGYNSPYLKYLIS